MPHLYIAAAHKSSGKTTTSIGLTAALSNAGRKIQTFKKGPDYIDPIWLNKASDSPCYNLDFNTQSIDEIVTLFSTGASQADIAIIEGNKGLYDGVDLQGADSNAAMAKLLNAPVVLTIDTVGITRGIAPLLQGYVNFDTNVNIAGVILNKVGGSRHENKLISAVEYYTDVPVVGTIGYDNTLQIPERHLGLVPANESNNAEKVIHNLGKVISQGVDLKKIIDIATTAVPPVHARITKGESKNTDIKIAIANDAAFGFYYSDDLEAFRRAGAELVPFDALTTAQLPDVDGLFIGGGFPETQMMTLSANQSLRDDIKQKILNGLPSYAECGGLMYLANSITWQGKTCPMVGVVPGDINMHRRPLGRGYVTLQKTDSMLWSSQHISEGDETMISAHEFHYASLDNLPENQEYAYRVKRGTGVTSSHDGIQIANLVAGFSHLRNTQATPWVKQFVSFVKECSSHR